jgi:hypothetical protein
LSFTYEDHDDWRLTVVDSLTQEHAVFVAHRDGPLDLGSCIQLATFLSKHGIPYVRSETDIRAMFRAEAATDTPQDGANEEPG